MARVSLRGFLIALSNAWGLFQIIIFLGYGTVSLPKACLKQADLASQHEHALFRVTISEENLQNARIELEDIIQVVLTVQKGVTDEVLRGHCEEMLAQCPLEMVNRLQPYRDRSQVASRFRAGDHEALVALNAEVKQQLMETKRREVTYEQILENAFFIEDVLKNCGSEQQVLRSSLMNPREGFLGSLLDRFDFVWHTLLKPKVFSLLSVVAIGFSLFLVAGELILLFHLNLSLLDILPGTARLLVTVSLLAYLSLCVYFGLFNLKVTSYYELHGSQQTDAFSLLYSANFLTKLAAPLCFNFLNVLHLEGTAFQRMLGVGSGYQAVPLIGDEFQKLFPATLVLLVLCNVFDVWSKLMVCLGLDDFTFAAVIDSQKIEDGRELARIGKAVPR